MLGSNSVMCTEICIYVIDRGEAREGTSEDGRQEKKKSDSIDLESRH